MSKGRVSQRARRRLECLADGGARGWTNVHCRGIWNCCWKTDGDIHHNFAAVFFGALFGGDGMD